MPYPAIKNLKKYSQIPPASKPKKDYAERERLIKSYAPLVKTIAGRLGLRLPRHISQDDLMSAGIIGLLDAIEKYNEEKGVPFRSYAEFRVRGAMLDELRSMDWAPRSVRRNARRIEEAYSKVENEKMRPATDEEVAENLGVDMDAFYRLLDETRGISIISDDEIGQIVPQSELNIQWQIIQNSMGMEYPSDSLNLAEIRQTIAGAIEKLPENERMVVTLYYYEELTMREIGEVMGYTESRISQLHTKAVIKLRNSLKGYFETEN